ncbi:MAG: alpha/beta hydrolase [Bacteroidetes bacterium HGW-Bacteroidetes-8]|nr:MAG: alpha/beta hydrolase [Bacteroidetes bacterium HGW-Bacteroidetes-8]
MKKLSISILFLSVIGNLLFAQQEYTNRYAMKLEKGPGGNFSIINFEAYSKILDMDKIPDLYTPHIHKPVKVSGKDYEGVVTKEFVYKTYPEYELKLAVDFAKAEQPAPFMVYIHGGGWARGDFSANRDISQYCAMKGNVTGVRISYTLANMPNANIIITIEDVKDAVKWVQKNSKMLNINPDVFGFMGGSAGGHLSAVAAMSIPGTKVLIGISGIYNLTDAKISTKATDSQRVAYFNNKDKVTLERASPINLIPAQNIPSCYLIHGTGDITVEYTQSVEFANYLKAKGAKNINLEIYPNYDHNISSTKSDLKEKLFLNSFKFIIENLK